MSKKLRRLSIVVLLVAAVAFLLWWRLRPKPIAVVLHTVGRGPVELVVANTKAGTVEAVRRAKLAPDIAGRVAVLNVKRNDRVEAGQVMLELWNEDLVASLALARAQLAQAEAQHREAVLAAEGAERERERVEQLREPAIASAELLDRVTTQAAVRRAAADAAGVAVEVARSRVQVQEAALERTRLRAPFAGVVAELNCELGEIVTPSPVGIPTPPTVDLIEEGRLRVAAPIDEVDVRQVRLGLPARITLDAFPGQTFPGKVVRIAAYVTEREKEARTVEVEVAFDDSDAARGLLPGLSADVEIVVDRRADVVRVPAAAVLEGTDVLVAVPADHARGAREDLVLERRRLQIGFRNWQWVEVEAGLSAGERILTSFDREGAVEGARVRAEPEAQAASR
ncbi:MAG TPA: efflux RND transporter periplasmic adaptor subunit [Planctomycetota bacterium]|nr:efflux RND transporter periplasmic adaptor subunit [Planctomycetota bacterium]